MREFVDPQLVLQSQTVPSGPRWVFEEKYDGHRAQVVKDAQGIRVYSRGGHDRTALFSSLLPTFASIPAPSFILDGEICALDANGRSDFSLLCQRLAVGPLSFVAFDCLERDGQVFVDLPLHDRRMVLEDLLADTSDPLHYARQVRTCGSALLADIRNNHGEGIVAKRLDAPYRSGQRSPDWLKIKLFRRQEFVIAGWHQDVNRRLQSVILATYSQTGILEFRGCVGTGFAEVQRTALRDALLSSRVLDSPFAGRVRVRSDVYWCTPRLLAEVQYGEITSSGSVRHPRFLGLRTDKDPSDVCLES